MNLLHQRKISYSDFIKDVKTGDICLMQGIHTSSKIIQLFENVDWSHSAILIWEQDISDIFKEKPETNRLLLWESNTISTETGQPPVIDLISGEQKNGPQIVDFKQRISHNFATKDDSNFAIRHCYAEYTTNMLQTLEKTILAVHSNGFPDILREFDNFIKGRKENKQTSDGTFFCSQLVAHTLMQLDLLSKDNPDNSYAPADFSETIDIPLLKRAWLGKEIKLDTGTIPK